MKSIAGKCAYWCYTQLTYNTFERVASYTTKKEAQKWLNNAFAGSYVYDRKSGLHVYKTQKI